MCLSSLWLLYAMNHWLIDWLIDWLMISDMISGGQSTDEQIHVVSQVQPGMSWIWFGRHERARRLIWHSLYQQSTNVANPTTRILNLVSAVTGRDSVAQGASLARNSQCNVETRVSGRSRSLKFLVCSRWVWLAVTLAYTMHCLA